MTAGESDAALLAMLPRAAAFARAPISSFAVGAAARGRSGRVHLGANLEFPGLPLTFAVHAEQAAIAAAWAHGETGLTTLAVTATPCGSCRQFLCELEAAATVRILVPEAEPASLAELFPRPFGPQHLGVHERLLQPALRPLRLEPSVPAEAPVEAALDAATRSYAPYSGNRAGIALELEDGSIRAGALAETAAFSPGLSPLQSALAALAAASVPYDAIRAAVLVEVPARASQRAAVEALLAAVAPRAVLTCLPARPA